MMRLFGHRKSRGHKFRQCFLCGATTEIQRHHVDGQRKDANTIYLCQICHAATHNTGDLSAQQLLTVRQKVKARDPGRFPQLELI